MVKTNFATKNKQTNSVTEKQTNSVAEKQTNSVAGKKTNFLNEKTKFGFHIAYHVLPD